MDLMALAARLTLDMKDYEEGIGKAKESAQSFSEKFGKSISKIGGVVTTVAKLGTAAIGAGSAAVGMLVAQSVNAYSSYEQLSGGVKKLFGDAASEVEKYASQAYKTAGMSANQYMEQATSFSASLINSLGGDTKKAAELSDVAMRAMSDNVNTFGSDMESVQNAFQGFSKKNYTMLDNLKLGYGGTENEMGRLIADANAYAEANGQAANLSMKSFADIIRAIELIQEKQGIAGTTAKEAATTIEGAFNMTKAAWENLVAGFANPDANMDQLMDNLIVAIVGDKKGEGLLNQLLPAIERALDGIGKFVEKAAPIIGQYLPGLMEKILPRLIKAATSLVSGVIKALPTMMKIVIEQIPYIVTQIKDALIKAAPMIVEGGKELIKSIYDGIIEAFPQVQGVLDTLKNAFETAFDAIASIATFIIDHIEQIKIVIVAAVGAITGLGIVGIISSIAGAITTVVSVLGTLISALSMIKSFAGLVSVISTLVGGPLVLIPVLIGALVAAFIYLWNTSEGFRNFWIGLWENIKTVASVVVEAVLGFFTMIGEALTEAAEFIGGVITTIISAVQTAWETIKTVVNVAIQVIEVILSNAVKILTLPWQFLWANFGGIITEKWETFKSIISKALNVISKTIKNVWTAITTTVSSILEKIKSTISSIWEKISTTIGKVLDTIKSTISTKWNAVKETVSNVLNTIKSTVSGIWKSIKETISNIIGNIVSGIKEKFDSILENAKKVFESVKDAITGPIETAKSFIDSAIETIKNLFANAGFEFPDIKLPHFSWDWVDIGGVVSVPSISIDWYRKAYGQPYMFTTPTVIGNKGFGDGPGGEMVYGHDNLMTDIKEAVKSAGGGTFAPVINIYTREGQSNKEIAEYVINEIDRRYNREGKEYA